MSFKTSIIKMAIKWTPDMLIIWVANIILKGIAELTDFSFDIDARKAYVQIQLLGESETIEVWLDGFAIVSDGESHEFIIHQAQSNRLWLNNLLARIAGKAWKIPVIPQLAAHIELISELFKAESPEQEVID
ncbi:MAG: hypothetical protein WAW61_09700 [Methylococcaceae bacterium]